MWGVGGGAAHALPSTAVHGTLLQPCWPGPTGPPRADAAVQAGQAERAAVLEQRKAALEGGKAGKRQRA